MLNIIPTGMLEEEVGDITYPHSQHSHSWMKLIIIALAQIGVSIGVVLIGSFLVAELKFNGWQTSSISIFLGFATIFETIRLYFGHLSDNTQKTRRYIIFGAILAIMGISSLPYLLLPAGNRLILIPLIFFAIGSAIVSTLIDAHLTAISHQKIRHKIAGLIQTSRILGFAIGGIIGASLYQLIPGNLSFVGFIYRLTILIAFFMVISILMIKEDDRLDKEIEVQYINFSSRLSFLYWTVKEPLAKMLYIFLAFYPLALFMQDFVIEAYAVEFLDFERNDIGQIVTISSVLTLIFIPFGVFIESKSNRFITFVISLTLMSVGITGFMLTSLFPEIFIISIVFFGIGSGINTAPGFAYLLDVCSYYKENMATMLGFSGLLITIGRSLAGVIAGWILIISENNYSLVFLVELVVTIFIIIPIFFLDGELKSN